MDSETTEPYTDPNQCDRLFDQIVGLDKDLQELVKLISLRGDGYKIPQSIFDRYGECVRIIDDMGALLFKKSKYEDTKEAHTIIETLYLELCEIERI